MKAALLATLLLAALAAPLAAADPPGSPPPSDPAPSEPASNATAAPTRAFAIEVAGVVTISPFAQCALLHPGLYPSPPYVVQVDWDCLWRIIHVGP